MISANMAKIQLNGKKISINQKFSLFDLLKKYKLNEKKIAIELNGQIITKNMYKKRLIKHNDKIEIVNFIGGG
jgi:thiamine biosynthesis protein ThiS|tara:strand:+ start:405 stop:623 length:219 start_codon:yes stop_codon:yes gene_type:complete